MQWINWLPLRMDDHGGIVREHDEVGQFYLEFRDGTIGSIPTFRFPDLTLVTKQTIGVCR
jgi:hypothetical protein